MPFSPLSKKKSPTIAPMTDSPAEMRSPANIAGRADGNITLRSRVIRPPWCSVIRSCNPGSPDTRPNRVFSTIGKMVISTHTITRDVWLDPKMMAIIGTRVRIGIACNATINGNVARSMSLDWLISVANATPSTTEMASPIPATRTDDHRASSNSCRLSHSKNPRRTTSSGGGTRKRRRCDIQTRLTKYQKPMNTAIRASGGSTTAAMRTMRRFDGSTRTVGASINDRAVIPGGRVPATGGSCASTSTRVALAMGGPQGGGDLTAQRGELGVEAQRWVARVRERHGVLGDDVTGTGRHHEHPGAHEHRLRDRVGDEQAGETLL